MFLAVRQDRTVRDKQQNEPRLKGFLLVWSGIGLKNKNKRTHTSIKQRILIVHLAAFAGREQVLT